MSIENLVRLAGVRWVADPGLPTEREVLSGIDLEVRAGERIGLLGPSGAGKTTLVTILAGLLDPTAGTVTPGEGRAGGRAGAGGAGGSGTRESGSEARGAGAAPRIGLVFQEAERGFFEETVLEDVSFGPRNAGLPEEEVRAVAREVLRTVGLDPDVFGSRTPETLSGGEARRAAIAGVLALRPPLLVLDEPTLGLDAEGVGRFRDLLRSLREEGVAYVLVSHDLDLVAEECERILVLENGRIAWEGGPGELPGGVPEAWRYRHGVAGGELAAVAAAMRSRGWIDDAAPITPEALAEAWAARGMAG